MGFAVGLAADFRLTALGATGFAAVAARVDVFAAVAARVLGFAAVAARPDRFAAVAARVDVFGVILVLVFFTNFVDFDATLLLTSLVTGFLGKDLRAAGLAGFLTGFLAVTLVGRDGLRAVGLVGREGLRAVNLVGRAALVADLIADLRAFAVGFFAVRAGFFDFLTIFGSNV